MTEHEATKVWVAMSADERLELWRENKESDSFSAHWSWGMFRLSPTAIAAALARRKKDAEVRKQAADELTRETQDMGFGYGREGE